MQTREYATPEVAIAVAKRAVYLAWIACGGAIGMGMLQDRGHQTEEQIWDHTVGERDYAVRGQPVVPGRPLRVRADYVQGRMMKMGFEIAGRGIGYPPMTTDHEWQSWARRYGSLDELFDAAEEDLNVKSKVRA